MEKSIADLLSDAFSENSLPSFAEDEDFENLDFKIDGTKNTPDQEDGSPLLETASASLYQNVREILDAKYNSQENCSSSEEENEAETDEKQTQSSHDNEEFYVVGSNPRQNFDMYKENVNKEDIAPIVETPSTYPCNDGQETFGHSAKNTEDVRERLEDWTSSEEERGEDEGEIEQKPGDFLETLHSSNDGEQMYARGQDLGQKDTTQDSNQEEEKSYFGIIQGHEGSLMIQDDSSEEDEQTESTKTMFFQVEYTLEYPEISYDVMEEFSPDTDKMENFSEEEHQEAGESFADYPSDFSSCEYVDDTDHESAEQEVTGDMFLSNEDCVGENSELCGKEELDKLEMTNKDLKLNEKQDNSALESWTEDVFSTWSMSKEDAKGQDKTDFNVNSERENAEQNIPIMNQDERCLAGVQTAVSSSRGSVDDSFFFNDESEAYDVIEEDDEEEERRREQARIQAFYRFYDDQDGDGDKEERQTKVQFCMETLSQVIHYDTDSSRELSSCSDEEQAEDDEEAEEEADEEEEEEKKEEKEVEEEEKEEKEEVEEEEEEEEEKEEKEVEEEEEEKEEKEEVEEKEEEEEEDKEEEEEKKEEEEELEEDTDQTDEVETCPSVGSDEAVLSSPQELQEIEDLTSMDSPPEIRDKSAVSTNKQICNRKNKCLSVLKWMLSLFLVVVMGLVMFWWVSEAEEWPDMSFKRKERNSPVK